MITINKQRHYIKTGLFFFILFSPGLIFSQNQKLYKDLGEGRLLFHTEFFAGTTYHRKTSQGTWTEAPGVIGMYLHGLLIR